jgi:hypothetical protein
MIGGTSGPLKLATLKTDGPASPQKPIGNDFERRDPRNFEARPRNPYLPTQAIRCNTNKELQSMPNNLTKLSPSKADKLTREALAVVDQFNASLLSKRRTRPPSCKPLINFLQYVVPAPGYPTPTSDDLITFALIQLATTYGLPAPTVEVSEATNEDDLRKRVLDDIQTRQKKLN